MKYKTIHIIRLCITTLLCWGIYNEAGPFTAAGVFLAELCIEGLIKHLRGLNEALGFGNKYE